MHAMIFQRSALLAWAIGLIATSSAGANVLTIPADQLILQRFSPGYCDVGLWCVNKQSVGHRIAYFDQLTCDTAFQFDAGGKLWCGTLVMSKDARVGLLITGDDTAVNIDGGAYLLDNVIIDGNIPNDKVCAEKKGTF
jgi:hypothetical protein